MITHSRPNYIQQKLTFNLILNLLNFILQFIRIPIFFNWLNFLLQCYKIIIGKLSIFLLFYLYFLFFYLLLSDWLIDTGFEAAVILVEAEADGEARPYNADDAPGDLPVLVPDLLVQGDQQQVEYALDQEAHHEEGKLHDEGLLLLAEGDEFLNVLKSAHCVQ